MKKLLLSIQRAWKHLFDVRTKPSLIEQIRRSYNKNVNVLISDKHKDADLSLFGGDVLIYPKDTRIGRILIDTGIAKSWSEVNGSRWKNYEIPWGYSDLFLDGLCIQMEDMWEKRRNWNGCRLHRLTILRWEDVDKKTPFPYTIAN